MPKGPRVHEIFSSNNISKKEDAEPRGINQLFTGRPNGNFTSKKKGLAPLPPMTRFGGHKPKILGGMDEFVAIEHSPPPPSPPPPPPLPPSFSNASKAKPVLTKPKPFIIGDKDTPMVLSVVDDADDENNNIDSAMSDMEIYDTPEDIDTKEAGQIEYQSRLENKSDGLNFDLSQESLFSEQKDKEDLIAKGSLLPGAEDFASENPAFTAAPENDLVSRHHPTAELSEREHEHVSSEEVQNEQPGDEHGEKIDDVHIPEPDYDEKEEMLEFSEEDPYELPEFNELLHPKPTPSPQEIPQPNSQLESRTAPQPDPQPGLQRRSQPAPHPSTKRASMPPALYNPYYVGEDFGRFLSDDEDSLEDLSIPSPAPNPVKMKRGGAKLNQKHLMFKEPIRNSIPNLNNNSSISSSVRGFSYADSKFGTKGRIQKKTYMMGGSNNDGPQLADDSYESFLFSRHGHTMPARVSGPGGLDIGQRNGANARNKDDRVWKKWTVRLKNKIINRNGYAMKET